MRARGFGVGSRGSARRRAILFGIFLLGTVCAGLLAYLLQQPVLQVYWAVSARLYPLKDRVPITDRPGVIYESNYELCFLPLSHSSLRCSSASRLQLCGNSLLWGIHHRSSVLTESEAALLLFCFVVTP